MNKVILVYLLSFALNVLLNLFLLIKVFEFGFLQALNFLFQPLKC